MNKPENFLMKLVHPRDSRWPSFYVEEKTGIVGITFMDILVIHVDTENDTLFVVKCDDEHKELTSIKDEIFANKSMVIVFAKAYIKGYHHGALMYY